MTRVIVSLLGLSVMVGRGAAAGPQPRRSFEEMVAEAPFVVHAKLEQLGSASVKKGDSRFVFDFAIVRPLGFLGGDPTRVRPAYRKRFPVFSVTGHYVGKMHADIAAQPAHDLYRLKAGDEVVLFVDLPCEDHSTGAGELVPPAPGFARRTERARSSGWRSTSPPRVWPSFATPTTGAETGRRAGGPRRACHVGGRRAAAQAG